MAAATKKMITKAKTKQKVINPIHATLQRTWGDLPVVDAVKDLRVMILPEDVQKATVRDPAACVFAQACRRAFKATKVLFYRRTAYVELPMENGKHRVERFIMNESMRHLIEQFDIGNDIIPEAGFILKSPAPGQRFEAKRKHRRDSDARRKLQGSLETTNGRITNLASKPVIIDLEVRSGVGAVRFAARKKST